MNQITGTIKVIKETKECGANGFTKREFVLSTNEKYPQDVKLELYKDDCALLNSFTEGDSVDATFNIKGNEYKGNYYVNLQAWKLKASDSNPTKESPQKEASSPEEPPKKRGRPKKSEETPELSSEDLSEDVVELADAPF